EVSEYAKLAQDLGFSAVGITMDTVRPVKIGDEVPLSTKDGKPRRGHVASPKDIEWMKQQVSLPVVIKGMMSAEDARTAVNAGATRQRYTQRQRYRQSTGLGRKGRACGPPGCVGRRCLRSARRRARLCYLQRRDEKSALHDRNSQRRRNHQVDFDSRRISADLYH